MLEDSLISIINFQRKNIDPLQRYNEEANKLTLKILDHATLRLGSSLLYNIFYDHVEPVVGSIVYCKLALNQVEHSGIYIGNGMIVHLDGSGLIEKVSASKFLERLDGLNIATSIYVSCKDGSPVGSKEIAQRAILKIGEKVEYSLFFNNCHNFSSQCISGNNDIEVTLFSTLVDLARKHIDFDDWRVWNLTKKSSNKSASEEAIENLTKAMDQARKVSRHKL